MPSVGSLKEMEFGWTHKVEMRTGAQLEARHMALLVTDAKNSGKNRRREEEGTVLGTGLALLCLLLGLSQNWRLDWFHFKTDGLCGMFQKSTDVKQLFGISSASIKETKEN